MNAFINMRALLITFILFLEVFALSAQDDRQFKFSGSITDRTDNKAVSDFMVDVFEEGRLVQTIASHKKGQFQMELPGGSKYSIEITKAGYYPKRAIIITDVPDDIKKLPLFKFEMEMIRHEEYEALEALDPFATSIFDFPYVIFEYDAALQDLNYRKEYTNYIKDQYEAVDDLR